MFASARPSSARGRDRGRAVPLESADGRTLFPRRLGPDLRGLRLPAEGPPAALASRLQEPARAGGTRTDELAGDAPAAGAAGGGPLRHRVLRRARDRKSV